MRGVSIKNYIGIDPDVDKSGVAFFEKGEVAALPAPIKGKLELSNLTFFQLFDYLKFCKELMSESNTLLVIVECGFLNKSNWHKKEGASSKVNASIGKRTGENHETAKKICEMLVYLEIPFEKVRPTQSKVKHEYFQKLTGVIGRTNQEQRDAAMLLTKYMF